MMSMAMTEHSPQSDCNQHTREASLAHMHALYSRGKHIAICYMHHDTSPGGLDGRGLCQDICRPRYAVPVANRPPLLPSGQASAVSAV